jgi:oxygen-independent coproporphyrinogen-3 oxidase
MCQGEIDKRGLEARFDIDFDQYFAHSIDLLPPLIADGLVIVDKDFIRVTLRGRLLLRVVAMCFDRYLQRVAEPARFSKAI